MKILKFFVIEFEGSEEVQDPKTGRSMAVRLTEIGPRISLRYVTIRKILQKLPEE